ncbi:MAG: hypothetical protein CMB56_000945 [Methanobacteriota archaeon]|nr:MAG: hypothetical protein CMB56_000945 [Euryarchaeota archaeon]|tara:strand:- start:3531 stop:4724 length:1194 start_codon:yes stop_codon:yes gene_type:complete
MSDENNEFSEELVDESLIDDVIIQPESEILEDIKDVESVDEDGQDLESEIDEIPVPLDETEFIPIGNEPVVPTEEDEHSEMVSDEGVTASGMVQEATMRIHQLMRTTGEAAVNSVRQLTEADNRSLVETEFEVQQAKISLQDQRVMSANKALQVAEKNLSSIEEDVQRLRRSIALLHRLLRDPEILRGQLEKILTGLRNATAAAEIGEVSMSATEVEYLVEDLVGGTSATLNPFLFRNFWFSLTTKWVQGSNQGVLIVNILNDSSRALPSMRLAPPVPDGWSVDPEWIDIPRLPPNGYLFLKFSVRPNIMPTGDTEILDNKLSVSTGYRVRQGTVNVSMRVENKGMEDLHNVLISPWLPPSFIAASVPKIRHLPSGGTAHIRMPIAIDFGQGRSMMV